MAWTIPDKGEGANDLQSACFQEYLDVLVAGLQGLDCVVSGCAVTAGTLLALNVAAGVVVTNGVTKTVGSGTANIATADATNPRLDLVVINSSGTIAVRTGTAAAAPKPAAKSANDVVLAVVYVPSLLSTVVSNDITDLRIIRSLGGFPFPMVPLTDGATVNIDPTKGHRFYLETSGGAGRSLDMIGPGYDGQIIALRFKNTHGSTAITHTLDVTGTDSFRYPAGFNSLNSIPAGAVQAVCAQYHLGDTKWDVLGDSLGTGVGVSSLGRVIGADAIIPANSSMYVVGPLEIATGTQLEIAAGSCLEIG